MRARTLIQGTVFVALTFFVVPAAVAGWSESHDWPRWQSAASAAAGWLLIAAGVGVTLQCSWVFRNVGRGTPVPIEPPKELVATGLYRHSRNPMYVAYAAIALGIALLEGHLALLVWALLFVASLQLLIVAWEEPGLRKRFGDPYADYCRRVPRWLGRGAGT